MTTDSSGFLWIGSDEGFYRLDTRNEDIRRVRSGLVQVIHLDRQGVLWLGRPGNGLSQFNPDTAIFKHYRSNSDNPQKLSDDNVTSIFEDKRGGLWIGTHGGGLNFLNRSTKTFTHYREKDGIPSDTIVGILGDKQGNLWLSTDAGLSKFDPESRNFRNYDVSDGLQSNEFNFGAFFMDREGEMFFGGTNGFNAFNPENIVDNPYIPPVVITSLQVFNQVVRKDLTDNQLIQLSYQENFLSFDFATLDFTAPEKNQYAYMMEGLDKDWVYAGTRRHADYPNLREGDYTFKVKGANNDGVWNDAGSSIRVIIRPPFWKTWWFEGIIATFLLVSMFLAYQVRIRSIKTQIQRQARVVEEERNRLARELHDSVTQSLYGVTLYAKAASGHIAAGNVGRAAEHLHELQETAQDALAEMRLLIHELRPSILEEQGLEAALQARLMAVESRSGLKVEFEGNLDGRLPSNVEENLYRIALEAFNNTLKHACAQNLVVYLRQEKQAVILEISDDGVGFDPDQACQRGGIGISALKERVVRLQGRVILKSSPGQGTHIVVEVPH
jgi:signal transduction histidine kinase/sugar lactone lactonase YvrE